MTHTFVPFDYERPEPQDVLARSAAFLAFMDRRRSLRAFSPDPVPQAVIENLVRAASTAPSGAHRQPWTFVAVSDPTLKRQIREAAEAEEQLNYSGRMPVEWLQALAPFGTDAHKPFLEIAPWLVILFKQDFGHGPAHETLKHYYVSESVGIAAGMFLTAVHHAGLVALTHTPSPMGFLQRILQRPANERPYLLMPVGYPEQSAVVPDLKRKPVDQILVVKSRPQ